MKYAVAFLGTVFSESETLDRVDINHTNYESDLKKLIEIPSESVCRRPSLAHEYPSAE
jgi:hypothetical protein